MHFYEYGKEKLNIMIHGAYMSWDKFLASMEILKKVYHVILVAVPGHDLTINEELTSVEEISKCIENMLIQKKYDNIECWYIYFSYNVMWAISHWSLSRMNMTCTDVATGKVIAEAHLSGSSFNSTATIVNYLSYDIIEKLWGLLEEQVIE